jgi:hypothetical protein
MAAKAHTIHHFFFKSFWRPWNEVIYQFIKICRLKIESICDAVYPDA